METRFGGGKVSKTEWKRLIWGKKLLLCWGRITDVKARMPAGEMETSEDVGWLDTV